MAHYLLLIDGTPSQGEGATTSTGPADAGKLIALGADGALDVSLLPADLTLSTLSLLNAPISDDQVPTKGYVDAKVSGIVWQNPVEGIADFTAAEPAPSTVGERWINTATGLASSTGQSVAEDAIYTWDGAAWTETLAEDAMTLRDRSSGNLVNFNGTEWVDTGDVVNHDSLAGLQGGLAGEHYHLSAAERSHVQGLSTALADKAEASDLDAHTTSTTAHGISAYGATLVGAGNAGIARTALALTDSATRDSVIVSNGFADAGKLPRLNGSGMIDASMIPDVGTGDGGSTGNSIPFFRSDGSSDPIRLSSVGDIPFFRANGTPDNIPLTG